MTTDRNASSRGGQPADPDLWHVDLTQGVCRMTTAEVEDAFRDRVIGTRTMVLPPGAPHWTHYGDAAAAAAMGTPPPESSDPLLFDSEPHSYAALQQPHGSVPPMATDVAEPLPWAPPPARFDGAFGPGNHDAAELRTRRLIFGAILFCALGGGFLAATGTSGLASLASRATSLVHREAPPTAAAAAPPPVVALPAPASATSPAPPVASVAAPAPPPTGVAADPEKPAKKKKKHH